MIEKINEKISVVSVYSRVKGVFIPVKLRWMGKDISIIKLGYHHKVKVGVRLLHYFSVSSTDLDFKLRFDTDSLIWTLEEVCDGNAN